MSCAGCSGTGPAQPFSCFARENCHPCMHTPVPLCTAMLTCTSAPRAAPQDQPGMPGPTSYQHSALIPAFCGVIFHFYHFFCPDPKVLQI